MRYAATFFKDHNVFFYANHAYFNNSSCLHQVSEKGRMKEIELRTCTVLQFSGIFLILCIHKSMGFADVPNQMTFFYKVFLEKLTYKLTF